MQQFCYQAIERSLILALLLFSGATFAAETGSERLPVEAFAKLPTMRDVSLSPSGKHLAYLYQYEGTTFVATQERATGKKMSIVKTDNTKYVISWLRWVSDDRFVFSVFFPDRRYGVATGETRLLSAGPGSTEVQALVKPRALARPQHHSQFQDRIIHMLPQDPDKVLLALDLEKPTYPGVYAIDVKTGKRKRVQRPKTPIRSWVADQQGNIRAGKGFDDDDAVYSLWVRRVDDKKWLKIEEYKVFERANIEPLGFGLDPHKLYIRDVHEGRYALFTIDTASPEFTRELVVADAKYDIEGDLVHSTKTGDVIGVRHFRRAGGVWYFDDDYSDFQKSLDRALPDTHNEILDFTTDDMHYLMQASSSDSPATLYIGNRNTGNLNAIGEQYPLLTGHELSTKENITYPARDGQIIHGYLSRPVDASDEPLPAIIFPHGGPASRDGGGFDYWTQFFTNRGYAVLQPNFRGSTGYGYNFSMASTKKWGLAMQDDLEDGVNWMVREGIVDKDRVCIAGASYGGYAALMGIVKTPALYRCAISFAGISSLPDLRATARKFVNRNVVREQIGTDKNQLRATSPLYHAEKIVSPVLIAHGERDRTVPLSQSKKMAKALKKSRKSYKYLELELGTHSLSREQNRIALFQAIDEFLAEHLPVRK